MMERLFTAYQVADLLGRPRHEVQAWIESGRLASQRLPTGAVRISEMQLVRFLRQEGIDIGAIVAETLEAEQQQETPAQTPEPAPQQNREQPDTSYRPITGAGSLQPRMAMASAAPTAIADQTQEPPETAVQSPDPAPDAARRSDRLQHVYSSFNDTIVHDPAPDSPATAAITESPRDDTPADDTHESGAPAPLPPADAAEPEPTDDRTDAPPEPDEPIVEQTPAPEESVDADDVSAPGDAIEAPVVETPDEPADADDAAPSGADVADVTPEPESVPPDEPAQPDDQPTDEPEAQATPQPEPEPAPKRRRTRTKAPDPARVSAQVARAVVADAIARGASAIHLRENGKDMTLHLRLNGALEERANFKRRLPKGLAPKLLDEFRAMANLDGDAGGHQCGHFEMTVSRQTIGLTVSALPTVGGREVVVRLGDAPASRKALTALGLAARDAHAIEQMLDRPFGLIVVAAPPRHGSGELLGAMTARQADGRRGVLALTRSPGPAANNTTACRCGGRDGMAWDAGLWAAADHDCDVVAVDDLGDPPTAAAAVESALEGRIVLAGMRAESSVEAIRLLLRMGVGPWQLASTLLGTVAMRTVPMLCADCRKPDRPARKHLSALGLPERNVDFETFIPGGCEKCGDTGYRGRAMLADVWPADEALADAIRDGAGAEALAAAAAQSGRPDLLEAALDRARKGQVALADLVRAGLGTG